jgi:hypothetical protein
MPGKALTKKRQIIREAEDAFSQRVYMVELAKPEGPRAHAPLLETSSTERKRAR